MPLKIEPQPVEKLEAPIFITQNGIRVAECWDEKTAKQIAAIPELLAACKFALMGYRNIHEFKLMRGGYDEDTRKHIENLEAIIAKVGES